MGGPGVGTRAEPATRGAGNLGREAKARMLGVLYLGRRRDDVDEGVLGSWKNEGGGLLPLGEKHSAGRPRMEGTGGTRVSCCRPALLAGSQPHFIK